MSNHASNIARTAVRLPSPSQTYESIDEAQFRLSLEQELQRVYAALADLTVRVEALEP